MSQPTSKPGSRPASKPASPKLPATAAAAAPASKRASASASAAAAQSEAKYDPEGRASAAAAAAGAAAAKVVSRPSSAVSKSRPTSAAANGPVKAVYRPAAAGAAAASVPAVSIPAAAKPTAAKSSAAAASSAILSPLPPIPRRPRRLPNLSPDDSDYDSEELLSEEETEDEMPLVHQPATPLGFALSRPDPRQIKDQDQLPSVDPQSDEPLQLGSQHLMSGEFLPVTSVAREHQATLLERNGAAIAAEAVAKTHAAGQPSFNIASFSSGPSPAASNDLLYTDAHAPFLYSAHGKPLTIWIIGKPLSGKNTLARKVQQELGVGPMVPVVSASAQAKSTGRDYPPSRLAVRDYSSTIALITPEFLVSHAKESSVTPGLPKFPEIDTVLGHLAEGTPVPAGIMRNLFIFALHSERVATHGYILANIDFLLGGDKGVGELAALAKMYPKLVESGVWPPQHVVELSISDEEILARLGRRKTAYLARRIGDVAGFKEPSLEQREKDEGANAEDGSESVPPSAPAGLTGGIGSMSGPGAGGAGAASRPTSAMSRRGVDDDRASDPALEYSLYSNLHRNNDVADWSDEEYDALSEAALLSLAEGSAGGSQGSSAGGLGAGAINARYLRLDSEAEVQEDLLRFQTTRAQLVHLLKSWPQFHAEGSKASLSSTQRLHTLCASLPLSELLASVLAILGQTKWGSGLALAAHLPFVAKEELRPIEEDEVRELLLLPNLNNSTKDLPGVLPPQTNDPSGLDLDSEAAFEHVQHVFGVWQTFCPVSLITEGKMVEGSEEFAASFQGHVYLMASAAHLRRFQDAPLKFVANPPTLPGSFVLSIVGGSSTGKSSLARRFADQFGWTVHELDGTEEAITRAAARIHAAGGGHHVLDGGPATLPHFELAQSQGLKIDKVAYVFVDDVEVLPGRVRLQRKIEDALKPPLTEEQKAAEAEAAAAAAALAEKAMSPAQKKKKAIKDAKSKADALAAGANASAGEDETTQEEEDLMDRVDEWQNDVWPNVLLPWLEEHAYACTEINNSTIVAPPGPMVVSITPPSAASAVAAAPVADAAAAAPAAPLTLPPAIVTAIDSTFESLRRCVDPFFNYRFVSRARRLTPEMVERSWKEEDRIPRGLPPAVTAAAAAAQANVAAGAAGGNGGGGTISSAVSQAGLTSSDNPRGLRFNDVNFCPVCLLGEQRLLVPGRHAEGVALGAASYSCCSERCALRFVAEPDRFNLNSPARLAELAPVMPALRILVTGGRASGKTHASRALQKHFGLSYSFSLGALLFPALKSLAQSTLALVMAAEAAEAEKRAAAKEARRAEKQARKDAAAAARLALAAAAGAAGEDADDADADDLESESDSGDDSFDEAESARHAEVDASKKDADILRLYISTQSAKIHEHSAILQELMEEEWFTAQQIEQLLRDILASHAWIDAAGPKEASNAAGWVCEVDLHSAPLLARLEAVLRDADPTSNYAKPHVILPMECAQRIAVQRLVATEEERRLAQRGEGAEAGEAGAAGGSDESSAQSAMLKNLSEKHRLKQEALEKAARELREKEEAAALAKANKPKRFGKDAVKDKKSARGAAAEEKEDGGDKKKKKSKKEAAAEAAAAEAALAEEKSQADAQAAEAAATAEAEAGAKSSADTPAPDASPAGAAAASASASGGEKSEADLALEAELEEKRAAAARALEELTAVMTELLKVSLETDHAFVSALKARPAIFGFVVLEPVNSTAVQRWGPESFLRRLVAVFETFLQAQAALFQPTIEISMSDANKLLRNGMRTFRAFGSFCPCCLLADEPVAYDCKVSLSNTGGRDYYPVMWSHNIVLTCSRDHKRAFCANARKYLLAQPPPPIVAPRIVVLESRVVAGEAEPMSVALARKLSVELNLVYLTLPSILSRLCAPSCALALGSHVREALSQGEALSDALLVQCVAHAVQSFNARARGWVLEGFPRTLAQARLLKQAGVVPHDVLTIHESRAPQQQPQPVQSKALAQRSDLISLIVAALEEMPPAADPVASSDDLPVLPFRRRRGVSTLLPPSIASVNLEAACVIAVPESNADGAAETQQRAEVERFYTVNYHNVSPLYTGPSPGSAGTQTPNSHLSSAWLQAEYALALVKAHRKLRQEYLEATHGAPTFSASRPGRIAHLGFTRLQLLSHASAFGDYCPVSWIRDGLLNRSEGVTDNALTVEYRQQFYRLASAEYRAIFEASPDAFVGGGEATLMLPRELPFVLAPEDAARVQTTNCELNGFCPVTIRQSALQGATTSVLPGAPEFTVCYRNRLYRMRGPREMQAFMSLPSVYSSVRLPQKMPPASVAPFTLDAVGVGGSGARAAGALGKVQSASDLLVLGKTLAFMEVEFSALLMKGLNSFEGLFPEAKAQRIKYPALPLSSSALLYLTLYLKTNNPRNPPHIKEKYGNKVSAASEASTCFA